MAATLSQGANIIMITPMQKYVNKYFEQKQLQVFCPQTYMRRPQILIRDRTLIGFLAKVSMFPLFGKQLVEIALLYMYVFCENQKTNDIRIKWSEQKNYWISDPWHCSEIAIS